MTEKEKFVLKASVEIMLVAMHEYSDIPSTVELAKECAEAAKEIWKIACPLA